MNKELDSNSNNSLKSWLDYKNPNFIGPVNNIDTENNQIVAISVDYRGPNKITTLDIGGKFPNPYYKVVTEEKNDFSLENSVKFEELPSNTKTISEVFPNRK